MKITPLKMWVQNVLPVVYDDSLSYYEMVGKINEKTNEIIEQVNENTDGIEALNYVIQQLGDVDELKALLEEVETIIEDLYSADTPEMDSTNGSAGVANHAARSDHSHPSDSSKANVSLGIEGASAGQFVKIKTVEAGVPTEFENGMPHEVPSGGNTGNILIKNSGDNFDAGWTNTPQQMGSLAYIEQTSTVSKQDGYQPGEYLVYNGQLYKVGSAAINQGQTITPGVNIIAVSVMSEMRQHVTIVTAQATVVSDMTSSAMAVWAIILNIPGYDRTRIVQFLYLDMTNPAGIIPTCQQLYGATNIECFAFSTNAQSQTAGNTITVKFLYEQ